MYLDTFTTKCLEFFLKRSLLSNCHSVESWVFSLHYFSIYVKTFQAFGVLNISHKAICPNQQRCTEKKYMCASSWKLSPHNSLKAKDCCLGTENLCWMLVFKRECVALLASFLCNLPARLFLNINVQLCWLFILLFIACYIDSKSSYFCEKFDNCLHNESARWGKLSVCCCVLRCFVTIT